MEDLLKLGAPFLSLAAGIFFYKKRSLRYLQFFQQEEYSARHFLAWFFGKRAFDTRGSIIAILAIVACCTANTLGATGPFSVTVAAAIMLCVVAFREENPLTTGKITLKLTARALRIYRLAFGLYAFAAIALTLQILSISSAVILSSWLVQLVLIQITPVWLLLATALLDPYEKGLQEGFANEARALIKKYQPTVIGITGSYGKTSTKAILKDVLGAAAPTFTTPKSINSYMGVTREIRERLKPEHRYAVIEMGAYYIGSIARMCTLTPPQAAIITAIGIMHLERFGGQDSVYKAKSELAQAVPAGGILVVNGDDERCRRIAKEHAKKTTLLYGLEPENKDILDAYLFDIATSASGSTFKIAWQGQEYAGTTALLGKPMLANLLACFTMAAALGVAPDVALAAIRTVKAESNRLEPVQCDVSSMIARTEATGTNGDRRHGKILRLNDAYNSNPIGFAAALDVLGSLSGGRKVLVTPGMIELGDRQNEENRQAAIKAAKICDLVLVVGDTNADSLRQGLSEGGAGADKIRQFAGMKDALGYLQDEYLSEGDIVLIENDLPDLYEGVVSF